MNHLHPLLIRATIVSSILWITFTAAQKLAVTWLRCCFFATPVFLAVLLTPLFAAVPAAHAQDVTLFSENFDAAVPPALPGGWSATVGEWETSDAASSSGSGLNNLTVDGGDAAQINVPALDLTHATSGTLTYIARRSGTFLPGSFRVTGSLNGGASFPVMVADTGTAAPADPSDWTVITAALPDTLLGASDVVFQLEVLQNDSSGGNIRIDDVTVMAAWEGGSTFGFASSESNVLGQTDHLSVPLDLVYADTPDLQGLEWTLTWDTSYVRIDSISMDPALAADWDAHMELQAGTGSVLLFNPGGGLPSGSYPSIATVHFGTRALEVDSVSAVIGIADVIGAKATPTGDNAVIALAQASHTLHVERSAGLPAIVESDITLGTVAVGDTTAAQLSFLNSGSRPVAVALSSALPPGLSVAPDSFVLSPDAPVLVSVTYVPTMGSFGFIGDTLAFAHDGEAGIELSVPVSAQGVGGRGDASSDGLVDVLDLVQVIDFLLGRFAPDDGQLTSSDLHPFPAGNGSVDVRDLTVLAQAILLDGWPDDIELPEPPPMDPGATGLPGLMAGSTAGSGGTANAATWERGSARHRTAAPVDIRLSDAGITMTSKVPLRALQLTLATASETSVIPTPPEGWTISTYVDEAAGKLRVLMYHSGGLVLPAGDYQLLHLSHDKSGAFNTASGVAIDAKRKRLPVSFSSASGVGTTPPAVPQQFLVGLPYPNPLTNGLPARIPLALPVASDVSMTVYDVLGRAITQSKAAQHSAGNHALIWNGRRTNGSRVAPGVYVIRIQAGDRIAVRRVVVR